MYVPTLTLTHKMVHYLVKIEQSIKEIREAPLPVSARKQLISRAGAESLFNFGKLTGAEVSEQEAHDIFEGKYIVSPGTPETLISNFRSTCDFIYASGSDKYISFSPSLLLHLNKLIFNGLVDNWDIGRFRNISDEINIKYDRWSKTKGIDFTVIEFQTHFSRVLNWFLETRYFIHPIIKIGCVIYELFKHYPFAVGNQATILAITETLFEKSKLSLGGIFSVMRNFQMYEDEYIEALSSGFEKQDDQTQWIERFIHCISLDLSSLKMEVLRMQEEKIHDRKKKLIDLNARQARLMRHLANTPKIKRQEYVKMMGVSTMTAYRDLDELVSKKIIEIKGGGRSTYYIPKNEEEVIAKDEDLRKPEVIKVINGIDA